jgi:hypothetical protein
MATFKSGDASAYICLLQEQRLFVGKQTSPPVKGQWNLRPLIGASQLRDTKIDAFQAEIFSIHDSDTTDAAQIQEIMNVKYAPADIDEMVFKCTHLMNNERSHLKGSFKSSSHYLMAL